MVDLVAIVLFGVGIFAGAAFVYQQLVPSDQPFAISKDDAIRVALIEVDNEPRRYPDYLPNE